MPLCKGRGWGGIAFCCGAIRSILSPPSGSCLFLLPIMCLALSAALGRRLCEGQLIQAGVDVLRPSSHPHLNPLPVGEEGEHAPRCVLWMQRAAKCAVVPSPTGRRLG